MEVVHKNSMTFLCFAVFLSRGRIDFQDPVKEAKNIMILRNQVINKLIANGSHSSELGIFSIAYSTRAVVCLMNQLKAFCWLFFLSAKHASNSL